MEGVRENVKFHVCLCAEWSDGQLCVYTSFICVCHFQISRGDQAKLLLLQTEFIGFSVFGRFQNKRKRVHNRCFGDVSFLLHTFANTRLLWIFTDLLIREFGEKNK